MTPARDPKHEFLRRYFGKTFRKLPRSSQEARMNLEGSPLETLRLKLSIRKFPGSSRNTLRRLSGDSCRETSVGRLSGSFQGSSQEPSRNLCRKLPRKLSGNSPQETLQEAFRKLSRKLSRELSRKVSRKFSRKLSRELSRKLSGDHLRASTPPRHENSSEHNLLMPLCSGMQKFPLFFNFTRGF